MKLYKINCGFTKNGYETNIVSFDNSEYDGNSIRYKTNDYTTSWMPTNDLDVYNSGMLNSDYPSISIYTVNEDKVDGYKLQIRDIIMKNLYRRQKVINQQLDMIKNV
jgi:hypothetical protein